MHRDSGFFHSFSTGVKGRIPASLQRRDVSNGGIAAREGRDRPMQPLTDRPEEEGLQAGAGRKSAVRWCEIFSFIKASCAIYLVVGKIHPSTQHPATPQRRPKPEIQ